MRFAVAALVLAGCSLRNPVEKPSGVHWQSSFVDAMAQARNERRPVVAVFYRHDCKACESLMRVAMSDERVQRELSAYVPILIDAAASPEFSSRFNVRRLPEIRLIDPDEDRIEAIYSRAPSDVAEKLQRFAESHKR